MGKAVITILGIQGGFVNKEKKVEFSDFNHKADYFWEENPHEQKPFFNTLPLLIEKYKTYEIIPIFTEDAKIFNESVLKHGYPELKFNFDETYLIRDEKDFKEIFHLIDKTILSFDEVIVDVSHGFRHLPILVIVDLIIQNFQNAQKVQKILFAKERVKHERGQKGLYEMIDLKEYLDLANIAFVLTSFKQNYTVSSHIGSQKYQPLINKLNAFSNDIMALSLNNLFQKSSKELIEELERVNDVAIASQAQNLKEKIAALTSYDGKKRYQTYYDLSRDLFEKNYMLLSLALLFESIRMYIKTTIKKDHGVLVEKVEKIFEEDLYKIGDFFKNLQYSINDKYERYEKNRKKAELNPEEYQKLKKSFDRLDIIDLYKEIDKTRNNLAHANSDRKSFKDIQNDIEILLQEYEKTISPKKANDLIDKFSNR